MTDVEAIFTGIGGDFIEPPVFIGHKLPAISSIILDWDGVFNDGVKGHDKTSGFSEANSMGLNMLRYSIYLNHGFLPKLFVVTGENNPSAIHLAKREHFTAAYFGFKNKVEILPHLKEHFDASPDECVFIFDDILDLSLAAEVGLRMFIRSKSAPMMNEYILKNKLCDYMTGNAGNNNGVRECCELLIGLNGNYQETLDSRIAYDTEYQTYMSQRNGADPAFFKNEGAQISTIQV